MRAFLFSIVFTTCIVGAQETPAEAAIAFAEGLRDGMEQEKLEALSALNPDTGERKKHQITSEWKNDAKKMLLLPFEVAEEKISGDNAAVVLKQFDPAKGSAMNLLSLAVVRRDKKWKTAPVLSSFQNSIVTYDEEILAQRRALEQWMVSREITLREELQTASRQRLREKMGKSISQDALKTISPRELIDGLIDAIRARDEAGVLARLGGFSADDVPEWDSISRRVSAVLSGNGLHGWPWKLLSGRQAMIAIGEPLDLGDEKVIDMLVLHPESVMEEPDWLSFQILQDKEGRSRVHLPEVFLLRNVAEEEMGDVMDMADSDHLALYEKLREQARRSFAQEDLSRASVMADVVEKSLQSNDFASFWGVGSMPANQIHLEGTPEIVTLWKALQGSAVGSSLFGRVGFLEKEEYALLVLQTYTPRSTDTIQLQKIWFTRKNKEWRLLIEEPESPPEEITKWWDENRKTWAVKLADSLVADAVRIGGLAPQHPEAARVREVFAEWLQAVQEKSLAKVIRYCAAFQDERSVHSMMRALAGELMYGSGRYEVLDVSVNGRWAAVSAKYLSDKPKSTPQYPLYVFVFTDKGPRLLPQVELKLSLPVNRSRTYLNNLAFTDLKKLVPDTAVEELQKLFTKHEDLVKQQLQVKP